jgi:hypothetical protein
MGPKSLDFGMFGKKNPRMLSRTAQHPGRPSALRAQGDTSYLPLPFDIFTLLNEFTKPF